MDRIFSFFQKSLFRQIISLTVLFAIVGSLLFILLIHILISENLQTWWLADLKSKTSTIAKFSTSSLYIDNPAFLVELSKQLEFDKSIKNVIIYNLKGNVWYKFNNQDVIELTKDETANYILKFKNVSEKLTFYTIFEKNSLFAPIVLESINELTGEALYGNAPQGNAQIIGVAQVILSDAQIKNNINLLLSSTIIIILSFMLAFLFVLSFIIKKMIKPVNDLIKCSGRVSSGNLEGRVQSTVKGELGTLIYQYNTMLDSLQSYQNELYDEKNRLNLILNNMEDMVFMINDDFRIEYMNPAALNNFSPQKDKLCYEIIYDNSSQCENCPKLKIFEMPASKAFSKEQQIGDNLYEMKYSLILKQDNTKSILAIIRDVTEKKQLEEERAKAQKLESIGILAGGIAHDFNNILTAIIGNITLSKMLAGQDTKLLLRLEKSEKACERAQDLARQLLTFAKGGTPVKKFVSLTELIKEIATFCLHGSNVNFIIDIPEDLPMIEADPNQIHQVFQNLVINAQQAMPKGGSISIKAEVVKLSETSGLACLAGEYIIISVKDEGLGISKENLSKVFDPFFTTKEKGSGLGLSTTFTIIKRHKGCIYVESEEGKGSTFYIYLPVTQSINNKIQNNHLEKITTQSLDEIKKDLRILIMDDEADVRDVFASILSHLGFKSEEARNGFEALDLYKKALEENKKFDLVFMDLTVPGSMGGKEAIKEILCLDRDAKVVVSSGYSDDPVMSDYATYGFSASLPKPLKIEDVKEVILRLFSKKDTN